MVTITFILALCASILAVLTLLGVWGVIHAHSRHLREMATDLVSLEERFLRDQKKRAGITGREQRENLEEAATIAAQLRLPKLESLPGRANGRAN